MPFPRAHPDIDSFALVPVMSLDKMEDKHAVKKIITLKYLGDYA